MIYDQRHKIFCRTSECDRYSPDAKLKYQRKKKLSLLQYLNSQQIEL